jgi:hypothetical protein
MCQLLDLKLSHSKNFVLVPMKNTEFYHIIDETVYERLKDLEWEMKDGYAVTRIGENKYPYPLHRILLGLEMNDGRMGDHINRIRLDNRRSNLRIANRSENMSNRSKFNRKGSTSKFKGVRYLKNNGYWQVRIQKQNKPILIGHYYLEVAAANMYNHYAREIHKEFAVLNNVEYMSHEECEKYKVKKGR